MQFFNIFVFYLLGLVCAAPAKRSASDIETDIAAMESQVTTFNTSVTAFTGTLSEAIVFLTRYNSLVSAITTATSEVKDTGSLTAADSEVIYEDVITLSTQIVSLMTNVKSKASVFVDAGYSSYAVSALKTLRDDTIAFYAALVSTIYSTYTSNLQVYEFAVYAAFTQTLAAY